MGYLRSTGQPYCTDGTVHDGDGVPLAFSINSGNTNEQVTMKPLEEQILKDLNVQVYRLYGCRYRLRLIVSLTTLVTEHS